MIIDSHAHLSDKKFTFDRDAVVARAREAGITAVIEVGSNLATSKTAIELAEAYHDHYAVIGIHPHEAVTCSEEALNILREMAEHPKVVAIGETGLDYYYNHSPKDVQQKAFHEHCQLALSLNLPLVVHDRDAHGDTMAILKTYHKEGLRAVLHCFSGSAEMARQLTDLGFYISFAGPVTFPNAKNLKDAAKIAPTDKILIETDCPYLAPQRVRGKRNEPHNVIYTGEEIATLKNMERDVFLHQTAKNAIDFFRLPL